MINKKVLFLTSLFSLFFYKIVSAEQTFKTVVEKFVGDIKDPLVSLFFTAAVVVFAYGISKYITGGEMTKSSAREYMIWGIIGIAVMSAVWGFVSVFKNTFGL
jgi:FtsH-binding integral membrane protein